MSSHALSFPPISALRANPALWPTAVLGTAAAVLAAGPAAWLVRTWHDPAYDSSGLVVFGVAAGLFLWSVTSPLKTPDGRRQTAAFGLLAASALARLASQVLAVNTIGALCLVADVYAVGLLAGLDRRARAVSPGWIAVVFAFSLPLERILQRSVGYMLQEFSAGGACSLLSLSYPDIACIGVRMTVQGADVLVDLPCSGARTLLLGLLGLAAAAALCRPSPGRAALGLAVTLLAAGSANVLRISVLAAGIAEPSRFGGIDVMAAPWHDAIGLGALSLVLAAVVGWAATCRWPGAVAEPPAAPGRPSGFRISLWKRLGLSLAALATALVIVSLPRKAVDVTHAAKPVELPLVLDGASRTDQALTTREAAFFTQFGGSAAKAAYGANGLMVTRTSSPLRHLHTPDDCLRGLGFAVDYVGASFAPVPTAVYRAVAPDGRRYRIEVSFVSDRGDVTTNVATAVWLWLQSEAGAWTAVQRITPEDLPAAEQARFSEAVLAALDLTQPIQPKG